MPLGLDIEPPDEARLEPPSHALAYSHRSQDITGVSGGLQRQPLQYLIDTGS